ncbi:MAG TPA: glycosyltransferase family 4 protein [Hyphomicrobiaceae bacterium]|nr:glycosyltransferase family 4 protein [Hyphomicrobiaceae bacterium]
MRVHFCIPGDITLPTGGYAYDRRILQGLLAQGVDARHVELPETYPAPDAAALADTLRATSSAESGDVLLIDGLAFGAMPAELVTVMATGGRHIVALVHHPLCLEAGITSADAARLRASERTALALATAVIVSSPMTARTLVTDFDVPPGKITVAEPGTDRALRAPRRGDPPRLLAVGSVVPRKAYGVLVEALSALIGLPWRLTIAGAARDAAEFSRVRQVIEGHGLAARIELLGAVAEERIPGLYAEADIFVMPSLYEGYGMALAEAMARGLPIVCTTGGAAAETCPDAAAIKVPPGDVVAFREALRRVLGNAPLVAAMSDASFAAGHALPTWDDTVRSIVGALSRIAR